MAHKAPLRSLHSDYEGVGIHMNKVWSIVPIPESYTELYRDYGNPEDDNFEAEFIVSNPHYLADGTLVNVQSHIAAVPALHDIWEIIMPYVNTYDGCYVNRDVRGSLEPSIHSWGLAIDLNASQFPLGSDAKQLPIIIEAFESHGWFWGGNFQTRKDPMHFQRAGDF